MENHSFSFENLDVYKEARMLVRDVYILQKKFPKEEIYALGDQVRRSILSVSSNIAEGSGRGSLKEKIHFIEISYGSLMEAYSQLQLAIDLKYITNNDLQLIKGWFVRVAKMLPGLRSSFIQKTSITKNP